MYTQLKRIFYGASKAIGLFHLSRHLTRHGLRILCYHGFAVGDEGAFRPLLFISPETFERRLQLLKDRGFPVLRLEDALSGLDRGDLPQGATVITIDDGLSSVYRWAFPLLQRYRTPAVLYLTTYYFVKQTPVFRLIVSYMFWKSDLSRASFEGLGIPALESQGELRLTAEAKADLSQEVADHGDDNCDNEGRVALCEALARCLGLDYERIRADRVFSLMAPEELEAMAADLVDIELHTHRHDFPLEAEPAQREIRDNRAVIEPIVGHRLRHFCYPSGLWSSSQWPILREEGVETATTIEPGLVYADTPRLALSRILDSEEVSEIEFEAEIYGFSELLRRVRRGFARRS